MDRRFAADEWAGLTNAERVRRCQVMAEEAIKLSKGASSIVAEDYRRLAEHWLKLATDLLQEMDRADKSRSA